MLTFFNKLLTILILDILFVGWFFDWQLLQMCWFLPFALAQAIGLKWWVNTHESHNGTINT